MTNHKLKFHLIKNNLKQHRCENCKNSEWLSNPIPIELHHIDGNNQNNDLNNLQILCPNCHALTPNYRGKNKKNNNPYKRIKINVNDETLLSLAKNCYSIRHLLLLSGLTCSPFNYNRIKNLQKNFNLTLLTRPRLESQEKRLKTIEQKYGSLQLATQRKINWPDKESLTNLLLNEPCCKISKKLGVSCSAVRKTAKRYGINIKEISPWSKKHGK